MCKKYNDKNFVFHLRIGDKDNRWDAKFLTEEMKKYDMIEKIYVLGPSQMEEDFDKAFEKILLDKGLPFHTIEFM